MNVNPCLNVHFGNACSSTIASSHVESTCCPHAELLLHFMKLYASTKVISIYYSSLILYLRYCLPASEPSSQSHGKIRIQGGLSKVDETKKQSQERVPC